jgi:erythronate-4-phosphate dehydrogenase
MNTALHIVIDQKIPFLQGVFEPCAVVDYLDAADITAHAVSNADALIVRTRTACNAALLQHSRVKFIAAATIGTDHIDDDFCKKNNIAWTNAAGCNAGAVQQYVATALLTIAHKKNIVLQGKTIGIVGVGHVGKRVAAFARQMKMQPLLCDPPRAENERSNAFATLDEIAATADIITFHVPLTHQGRYATYHLADDSFFSRLAKTPVFINTSRGEVVDEFFLRKAILQQKICAAALDVWEHEPQIDEETLRLVDIGTPHIAGYSAEGKAKASEMAVQAIARFFDLPLKDWQPSALPAIAADKNVNAISLQNDDYQQFMYRHYKGLFDILADDAALRAAPHQGEALRNGYTLRRENSE